MKPLFWLEALLLSSIAGVLGYMVFAYENSGLGVLFFLVAALWVALGIGGSGAMLIDGGE